ncbi:CesT family type III secretion system chaperone [Chromobacterium violaceum]|uniref:CesT family type III secretion system chaperone n=1 Tax=Chromobacterium violaceum TaxID=536 RepID=UPI0009DB46E7|nr:CesT family type III secretion system chaperone [Chromobacterium violaceum]OQS49206.1 hypothetical protein B0T48_06975 [Chromobacterium violaceum]OQS51599.1 hypothetical protein B0T49_08720 [Chromobacterium violaceum]QRO31159.1 CesT family type III secretion system chaperone [Chromobacterium violaceum]QRQ19040.1 CesT family type III secretion system chaperone [Chromobacterium violaceum]
MHDLTAFHHCAAELLRHLGFDAPQPAAGQEVVSLTVEQRFTLHLGAIDQDSWFMQADLGDALPSPSAALLERALRGNQIAARPWQPVAALDTEGRLGCWLRLPSHGVDLPMLAAALDALIAAAEDLLGQAEAVLPR